MSTGKTLSSRFNTSIRFAGSAGHQFHSSIFNRHYSSRGLSLTNISFISSPSTLVISPKRSFNMVTTRSKASTSPKPSDSTSSATSTAREDSPVSSPAQTIAIVGTGWAGWTLAQELHPANAHIILISPSRTMALTPLLASAACSIFDFRMAEEPVRRRKKSFIKYQASISSIDFPSRQIRCKSAIGSQRSGVGIGEDVCGEEFNIRYDKLILSPGCETNTFGTPGVKEHALFMKSVKDASTFRERVLDCFEEASLPTLSDEEKKDILHFVIVGGGPTGVELAAEVDELVENHLSAIYPHVKSLVTISIYDVADRVLGQFDDRLSEYAMQQFRSRPSVSLRTGRHIEAVEKNCLKVKEEGTIGFGVCVWAVGNKACALVESLDVKKSKEGLERILTDRYLRVLPSSKTSSAPVPGVYALGDAADVAGYELPTTAEVAVQKAKWLARYLNSNTAVEDAEEQLSGKPFEYTQKALIAYIGRGDGVIEGKRDWTGAGAWLAWRSGSLEWTRGWRRKAMMIIHWVMNKLDGREIARR
jgi:NADH:ubiquinone reductase (non-electrogenic)